jgi:two-component system response regulator
VPDGEACLAALLPEHGTPVQPALVLLDINLPKIGGLEVLDRLRADPRTSTLPVVILTTSRERRDVLEGYRLGANSYVCKPVSFSTFVAVMRTLATYWLRVNEPRPHPGAAP